MTDWSRRISTERDALFELNDWQERTTITSALPHRTGRTRYHRKSDPGGSVAEMARADYDVNECAKPKGSSSPIGDRSFRGCIAALLAFLLLCIILIVISAVIRSQRKGHKPTGDASRLGKYDSYAGNVTTTTNQYGDILGSGREDKETQESDDQKYEKIIVNYTSAAADTTQYVTPSTTYSTEDTESTTTPPPIVHNVPVTYSTSNGDMVYGSSTSQDPSDSDGVNKFSNQQSLATSPAEQVGQTSASDVFTSTEFKSSEESTTVDDGPSTVANVVSGGSSHDYLLYKSSTEYSTEYSKVYSKEYSSTSQDPSDSDGVNKFSNQQSLATTPAEQVGQTSVSDVFTSTEFKSSEESTTVDDGPSTVANVVSGGSSDDYLLYKSSTEYSKVYSKEYSTEHSTESSSLEGSGEDPTSTISGENITFLKTTTDIYTGATNDYSTSTDESSSSASLTFDRIIAQGSEECETSACYKQAVHMLSMMNHTMDPCEDFYVYACGGLQTNPNLLQPNPEKPISQKIKNVMESVSDSSSPSLIKMKNFYHSCMTHNDSADLQYVFQVLKNIYDYNDKLNYSTIYTELFSMLLKYNCSPLFDVLIDVEDKINPHFVFKIVDPQYGPSIFSYDKQSEECKLNISKFERKNGKPIQMDDTYLKYKLCQKNIDITDKVFEYVKIFGYDYLISDDTKGALRDLRSLMSLFSDISSIRHGLLSKDYVTMSVKELETNYPLINWLKLFSNLVNNSNIVKETDTVQVYFKFAFDKIFGTLQNFTQSDPHYIVHMNNALHALSVHRMFTDIVTVHNPCNRHDYCMNIVKTLMTDIASTAYLSSFTYKELVELKLHADKTFQQLKSTIREQLTKATWLDEQSKSTTIEQLDKMSISADGGMDFYHNFSYVDSIWKNIVIEKNNYLQNALDLVLFRRNLAFSLYGKDPRNPKYIWSHFQYPINLDAHFIYGLNMIIIPTSLLCLDSNNADLPHYIRMASEGFIMAHEIAHTFDFTGIMFGPYGKGDSQLTQNSKSTYEQMEYCYNFQYDFLSSFLAEDGYHLDFKTESQLSNNERFSDYTGIKLAYDTFIKNYNNENKLPLLVKQNQNQLFFLQAAQEFCSKDLTYDHFVSIYEDEHLPSAVRVKNMMSNTKEFLDVFKCKKNSKMHIGNPCDPFPDLREDDMSILNR